MAIDAIRKNKLRSTLTLLGISIGVFSVIGVMTAIRTLESSVESGLNVFAANTFVVQKNPEIEIGNHGKRKYRNRKNITIGQYKKLKEMDELPNFEELKLDHMSNTINTIEFMKTGFAK